MPASGQSSESKGLHGVPLTNLFSLRFCFLSYASASTQGGFCPFFALQDLCVVCSCVSRLEFVQIAHTQIIKTVVLQIVLQKNERCSEKILLLLKLINVKLLDNVQYPIGKIFYTCLIHVCVHLHLCAHTCHSYSLICLGYCQINKNYGLRVFCSEPGGATG